MVLLFLCFLILTGATAGTDNLPGHHDNIAERHGNFHGNIAQQLTTQQLGSINQSALVPLITQLLNTVDMATVLDNAVRNLGNSSTCLTKIDTLAKFSNLTDSIAYFDTMGKPASGALTRNIFGMKFIGSYDECMALKDSSSGIQYI